MTEERRFSRDDAVLRHRQTACRKRLSESRQEPDIAQQPLTVAQQLARELDISQQTDVVEDPEEPDEAEVYLRYYSEQLVAQGQFKQDFADAYETFVCHLMESTP